MLEESTSFLPTTSPGNITAQHQSMRNRNCVRVGLRTIRACSVQRTLPRTVKGPGT